MGFSRKNSIMLKMMMRGYREENFDDEIYLMQELRAADHIRDFKEISKVLGMAAGLFAVPTLMAFAVGVDPDRSMASVLALGEISARTPPGEQFAERNFFNPDFWRSRWVGSQSRFISYVYCIAGMVGKDEDKLDEGIDEIGERLVEEMNFNLFPYGSFREMRVCMPDWDVEQDVKRILSDVAGEMLVGGVLKEGAIAMHPDSQYEENLINMRCDYLLTKLNFDVDYGVFRCLLKAASVLNTPE